MELALAACGGDDESSSTGASGSESSTAAETDGSASATLDTSGPSDETSVTSSATLDPDTTGTDTTGSATDSGSESTGAEASEYAALVRGPLFTADLDEAQAYHDALASGAQAQAEALGDFGHDVVLGTTLLGTTENEFVAVDRWTTLEGAMTLYGDPMFQRAFGPLFAEPVVPELFERNPDWHGWGELDSGDEAESHVFVVVRGRLAADDIADAQTLHDELASAGEAPALELGDVAHVVWLGAEDPHEFFAIDVWTTSDSIEGFYSNPDLQEGFGMLFAAPPSVGVYRSTDWYQW
jgi:hypothetical protein